MRVLEIQALSRTQRKVLMQKIKSEVNKTFRQIAIESNTSVNIVSDVYSGNGTNERVIKTLLRNLPEGFWSEQKELV